MGLGFVVLCAVIVALAIVGVLLVDRHINQRLGTADAFAAERAAWWATYDDDETETSAERALRLRGARVYDIPGQD